MPNCLQSMMEQAGKPTERQLSYARQLASLGGLRLDESMTRDEIGAFLSWAEGEFHDFIEDVRSEMFAFSVLNG